MSNRNPTFLLGSHPSRLSLPVSSLSSQVLSLSRSLTFTTDQLREPGSPLFVLFSPSFHPDPRDSHEYSSHDLLDRLGREESSLVYRPFSSPFSVSSHSYPSYLVFVLFISSVHRFLSFSIATNAVKDGNVDKIAYRRRFDVIYVYAIVKQKSWIFSKHYRDTSIIILASSTVEVVEPVCYYKCVRIITKQRLAKCIDTIYWVETKICSIF